MEVIQAIQYLFGDERKYGWGEVGFAFQFVGFYTVHALHDYPQIAGKVMYFMELNDVWVPTQPMVPDFVQY